MSETSSNKHLLSVDQEISSLSRKIQMSGHNLVILRSRQDKYTLLRILKEAVQFLEQKESHQN